VFLHQVFLNDPDIDGLTEAAHHKQDQDYEENVAEVFPEIKRIPFIAICNSYIVFCLLTIEYMSTAVPRRAIIGAMY
jgi:hypothetical protein